MSSQSDFVRAGSETSVLSNRGDMFRVEEEARMLKKKGKEEASACRNGRSGGTIRVMAMKILLLVTVHAFLVCEGMMGDGKDGTNKPRSFFMPNLKNLFKSKSRLAGELFGQHSNSETHLQHIVHTHMSDQATMDTVMKLTPTRSSSLRDSTKEPLVAQALPNSLSPAPRKKPTDAEDLNHQLKSVRRRSVSISQLERLAWLTKKPTKFGQREPITEMEKDIEAIGSVNNAGLHYVWQGMYPARHLQNFKMQCGKSLPSDVHFAKVSYTLNVQNWLAFAILKDMRSKCAKQGEGPLGAVSTFEEFYKPGTGETTYRIPNALEYRLTIEQNYEITSESLLTLHGNLEILGSNWNP